MFVLHLTEDQLDAIIDCCKQVDDEYGLKVGRVVSWRNTKQGSLSEYHESNRAAMERGEHLLGMLDRVRACRQ